MVIATKTLFTHYLCSSYPIAWPWVQRHCLTQKGQTQEYMKTNRDRVQDAGLEKALREGQGKHGKTALSQVPFMFPALARPAATWSHSLITNVASKERVGVRGTKQPLQESAAEQARGPALCAFCIQVGCCAFSSVLGLLLFCLV